MTEPDATPPGFDPPRRDPPPEAAAEPDAPSVPRKRQRPRGLQCPRCGCRHFVTPDTVPVTGAIRRYRICRHCGRRVITREIIER